MKESVSPANHKSGVKNNENLKKIGIIIMAVIFLLSAFIAFRAFTHKSETEQTQIINTVEQKVSVDYSAVVLPSILYPEGGRITPDDAVFTQLTSNLIVDLKMEMDSEKPIKTDAFSQVILRIVASDTWQRDAVLIAQAPIEMDPAKPAIIDQEIDISLREIMAFIDSVEQETLVRPGNYQLQIIPRIQGNILDDQGKKIASADNEVVIPFDMTSQYLRYAAEEKKKEFVNTIEIEDTAVLNQDFDVFGINMSQRLARILFSALGLISLIVIIVLVKLNSSAAGNGEEEKLRTKYADQMAEISEDTVFGDKTQIILKDFKSLIKISEEKEEPILKKRNSASEGTSYHVIGSNHLYTYESKI